ncbi:MAG: transposase family protein [Planctomycetes bacterium]|nr:transposase family protein [Planctomycetota bacterium]
MDADLIFSIGLGLESPWHIVTSHLDVHVNPHRLDLRIEAGRGALYPRPDCGRMCKAHEFAERTWRHLNFFQHHCFVTAPVPRTDCPEHGIKTVTVFIDMEKKNKPVLFATPGKGKDTLAKFGQHLEQQGGKAGHVLKPKKGSG